MNGLNSPQQPSFSNNICLLIPETQIFEPKAEDILTDEDLLDLFRIVKQVLRKNPDSEKLAKLLFCMFYALGDHIKFTKPCHEDRIVFRDNHLGVHAVRLPSTSSCCSRNSDSISFHQGHRPLPTFSQSNSHLLRAPEKDSVQSWIDSTSVTLPTCPSPISSLTRLPAVSYLGNTNQPLQQNLTASLSELSNEVIKTNSYTIRPYTNFRPLYTSAPSPSSTVNSNGTTGIASPLNNRSSIPSPTTPTTAQHVQLQISKAVSLLSKESVSNTQQISNPASHAKVVMEPQQRGFYYQDDRILREPVSLQRYAEQGILTQASLMRKRKKNSTDKSFELSTPSTKKPKIPHRHGEFERRRDDIINRLREITMEELEQKAQRMPNLFTLAIDQSVTFAEGALSATVGNEQLTKEQLDELLEPALRILTNHSNMKPHLDNGMNQNGIYYNSDYFRLYLAFEQFQRTFAILLPDEVTPDGCENEIVLVNSNSTEREKDRERNANMKAYRLWIEPLLTETNWAAFRRNIVVGERIMQLTKGIGQGVLLMTKELSGSKLHLTFTNSEWDEFINGLTLGKWDQTIELDDGYDKQLQKDNPSLLVSALQQKFATHYWFHPDGLMISSKERWLAIHDSTISSNNSNAILMHQIQ